MPARLVRPILLVLAVVAAVAFVTASAAACPLCDGPAGDGVNPARAELFGPGFWPNGLAAAAPFAVLLGVAAAVRFGPPWRTPR